MQNAEVDLATIVPRIMAIPKWDLFQNCRDHLSRVTKNNHSVK